ncbi:HAD family hydrolase [Sedimentibacter sp.]|uniref:HAD family hydrolase n=1 Tax=Sedimentibacter sp. TaxID=1960295 RepID=UPI0028977548|nr:HAD family hydrolase [Sedimentibacter sp.]
MIKAIFFDLFFTLVYPSYSTMNEYDVMGISAMEWEKYAEDSKLYRERALGNIKTEKEIINKIVDIMPYNLNDNQKREILNRRQERMKRALLNIDNEILNTIKQLHDKGIKLGLISNSDIIDSKHWKESPLSEFFDVAVFSCDAGIMKPDTKIYETAMYMLGVNPKESIFVGDGGSDELYGAKIAGMRTVFTEYLERKPSDKIENIKLYADFHIDKFYELLRCLE